MAQGLPAGMRRRGKRGIIHLHVRDPLNPDRFIDRSTGTADVELARVELAKLYAAKERGESPEKLSKTFEAGAALFMHHLVAVAESTRTAYQHRLDVGLLPFFGPREMQAIGEADLLEYIRQRRLGTATRRGVCDATITLELKVLGMVINHFDASWVLPKRKRLGLRRSQPIVRYFRDESEFQTVLACLPEKHRPVAQIARYTGLRLGSVVALEAANIDLFNDQIEIPKAKGKERLIAYIPANLRPLFVKLVQTRSGRLFPKTTRAAVSIAWRRARIKAGFRVFRFHDIRHAYGSYMVQRGVPLKVVQDLMHHSSIQTTEKYAHLDPETRRRAMDVWADCGQAQKSAAK